MTTSSSITNKHMQEMSSGSLSTSAMSPNSPNAGTFNSEEDELVPFYTANNILGDGVDNEKYKKYFELEKEAEMYKDLPETTFLIIDYNAEIFDANRNEKILCSRTVREKAFQRKLEKMMELNRRQRANP